MVLAKAFNRNFDLATIELKYCASARIRSLDRLTELLGDTKQVFLGYLVPLW